jgi:ribonuclease HI
MLVEVYSDGSGTTGDLPGGYGWVVCVDGVKVAEGSGGLPAATNNTAEVTAAIRGLDYVATTDIPGCTGLNDGYENEAHNQANRVRLVLISDSQLTLKWATGEYQCKKWHLIPLVIELRKLMKKLNAETRWVKGHNGNEHNERCDVLAGSAREAVVRAANPSGSGSRP